MVFQSAMNSLNPVLTIESQFYDVLNTHTGMSRPAARERAAELLALVDIPTDRLSAYPHQLSGGMRQRIVIAICLALSPKLLIMDEPTTALDVVVQREILQRIHKLRQELGFSVLFITHDLALMVQVSDRIGIMLEGELVEVNDGAGHLPLAAPRLHATALGLDAAPAWRADRAGCCAMSDTAPIIALDNVSKIFGRGRCPRLCGALGLVRAASRPHAGAGGRIRAPARPPRPA